VSFSPRIRIFALVGVVAAVGLLLVFMVLGRGSGGNTAAHQVNPHPFGARPGAKAAATPSAKRAKAASLAPPGVKAVPVKPLAKPATNQAAASPDLDGLPAAVDDALVESPVVVALVYDPRSAVDRQAAGEAEAGARDSNAAFVRIDTLKTQQVRALTQRFGILPQPAVLILRRPSQLYVQLSGFADRQTVAQAAHNAAPLRVLGGKAAGPSVDWAAAADKICVNAPNYPTSARTRAQALANIPVIRRLVHRQVAALVAIPLPSNPADRRLVIELRGDLQRLEAQVNAMLDAAQAGDRKAFLQAFRAGATTGARLDQLAGKLGAGGCLDDPTLAAPTLPA